MDKLRYVGTDEPLTTEQGLVLRDRIITAARRTMIGRKLLPITAALGEGATTYGYNTLTEVSDARIDYGWPGAESLDIVNLARTNVEIPNIHKEFEINKLDLNASRRNGTPLNLSLAESATYKASRMENSLILDGWKRNGTYEINGLYRAAGNDETTNLDWGTATNIPLSITAAMKLMLEDEIDPPYNLVLHPQQWTNALALIGTSANSWITWIREAIQGEVYQTAAMTNGTGLLSKANPEGMFEYVPAEDLTLKTEVLQKSENLWGKVYIRALPVVYNANALCKLSDIGT
jgi:uncharacterized linocin/CFP29 family protein